MNSSACVCPVVDAYANDPARALLDAIERRRRGEPFAVRFLVADERSSVAQLLCATLLAQERDHDRRRAAFDSLARGQLQLGGRDQAQLRAYDPRAIATLRDVAKLADFIAVHSWCEYVRILDALATDAPPQFTAACADPRVPTVDRAEDPDAIVVWAPDLSAGQSSLLAFALEELHAPAYAVVAGGTFEELRTVAVPLSESAPLLARARLVIDASLGDPSDALGLARLGVPLVAASTSGADEYLDGVALYDPWDRRSVVDATLAALGLPPPRERDVTVLVPNVATPRRTGPLVSIVVKTRDRPALLERALTSLAAQTYRDLEIIVVNDAGCDVAPIVERFGARLIEREVSGGPAVAGNQAAASARGTYIGFLDDDDELFADHVAILVEALRNADAEAAVAQTITAFSKGGEQEPSGYTVFLDGLAEPSELYLADNIGPMAMLLRRETFERLGGYDVAAPRAIDWDLLIRVADAGDVVHVRRVTGCYHIREDGSNMMSYAGSKMPAALQFLENKYPTPDRPLLTQLRLDLRRRTERVRGAPQWPRPPLNLR